MDQPAVERVQSEHNGELQQFLSCFEAMRRESQEDRKIMHKQSEEVFHSRIESVETKFEANQASLHERVKNLEERLKANQPKSVEHQLQEKEKVNRDSEYKIRETEERRRRKDKKHRRESRSHCPRKREFSSHTSRSSSPPDLKRTRTEKRDANTAKNSCLVSNGGVAESGGILILSERQLHALMKGRNCVAFIGELLLSSFPRGYFLKKKYKFSDAISSHHIETLFEIVSSRFKEIQRRGQPSKPITKEEMLDVMKNKVTNFRSAHRHSKK